MRGGLTEKQAAFVREYLIDLNAAAAYRRAGYRAAGNAAAAGASRLLRNARVAAAVAEAQAARAGRMETEADRLLAEIDLLATSDIGEVLDFTGTEPRLKPACEISPAARRCVAGIKVRRYTEGRGDNAREVEVTEFKLWNKLDALRLALQRRGLLKNVNEHVGPGGGPIQFIEVAAGAASAPAADRGSDKA